MSLPPSSRWAVPFAAFTLAALFTAASAVPANPVKAATNAAAAPPPAVGAPVGTCGYVGNADVYGLGIRIGLYTQWLSTLISNWLHQHNISRMRDVNTCFQIAMLIALLALNNSADPPHAMDLYIIIVQIVGSTSTISAHATNPKQFKQTSWGGVLRFLIYWAVAAYSTYFWFRGIHKFRALDGDCTSYGFAFARVPITPNGWFALLHKIVSLLAVGVFTVLCGWTVFRHWRTFVERSFVGAYRARQHRKLPPSSDTEKLLDDLITPGSDSPVVHKISPIICVVVLLISVAANEMLIRWNGIVGVNDAFSTGQLIPMVTGIGGLIRVCYMMWAQPDVRMHFRNPEKNRPLPQRVVPGRPVPVPKPYGA
ncbi:hypothetical protein EDC01DRAFT_681526 [Geopyxis carbonaria]|nr:hypothetical protein EDC01DRAFT_681526 [Geopyxis carbonaria]